MPVIVFSCFHETIIDMSCSEIEKMQPPKIRQKMLNLTIIIHILKSALLVGALLEKLWSTIMPGNETKGVIICKLLNAEINEGISGIIT